MIVITALNITMLTLWKRTLWRHTNLTLTGRSTTSRYRWIVHASLADAGTARKVVNTFYNWRRDKIFLSNAQWNYLFVDLNGRRNLTTKRSRKTDNGCRRKVSSNEFVSFNLVWILFLLHRRETGIRERSSTTKTSTKITISRRPVVECRTLSSPFLWTTG